MNVGSLGYTHSKKSQYRFQLLNALIAAQCKKGFQLLLEKGTSHKNNNNNRRNEDVLKRKSGMKKKQK